MTKANDPKRERSAWIRCCAAVLLAVILLAVSGFGIFKMTGTPADFAAIEMPGEQTVEPVGSAEEVQTSTIPASRVGDYVQHEVFLLLKQLILLSSPLRIMLLLLLLDIEGEVAVVAV